jgi:ABC-type Zn uptake system ZnuABC Zn-binding protein ZnuA
MQRRRPGARVFTAVAAAAVGLALSGCSEPDSAGPDGRLNVVTTVSPITNIVQNVAGPVVKVTGIVPEGTNSHTFEPAPTDGKLLAGADLVIMNGLHLEEPTRVLAEKVKKSGARIVQLGEKAIEPADYAYDFSFPEEDGDPNPHLWTDPEFVARYAEIVRDVLIEADGANADTYRRNASVFIDKARAFTSALHVASATVPERKLLTYHDAYAYFARRFGWTVIGAIQPSDFSEPRPRDVAEIIAQIKREKVRAIFGSEVFPSPVLEQIAKDSGARYVDALRDDDLPGKNGDPDHSLLGLLKFDYVTMVEALGGDANSLKMLDVANIQSGDTFEYRY